MVFLIHIGLWSFRASSRPSGLHASLQCDQASEGPMLPRANSNC